jgi:hypothetical protein
MSNKHLNTTFPYDKLITENGYPSSSFEQFLRALHIRTGNKEGINVQDVQQTAQDALQTAVNAKAVGDIALATLFLIDQNLQKSNLSLQGLYSTSLNNQALILAILSQLGEKLSELEDAINSMKGNNNGI